MATVTQNLVSLRQELLATLVDLDSDVERVKEAADLIVSELERLIVQAADDTT